jgi:hypothetical protein
MQAKIKTQQGPFIGGRFAAAADCGGMLDSNLFISHDDSSKWGDVNVLSTLFPQQFLFTQQVARNWRLNTMKSLVNQLELASQNDKNKEEASSCSSKQERRGILLMTHHLDDSYESLLLKVLRGVHISNIRGMQSVQELEMEENDTSNNTTLLLVRPLLSLRKQDLYYDYLKSNNYTWREDESNAENKYQRNKVRNQLIPLYWKNLLVEQTFSKNGCSHINNQVRKFTTT